MTDISAQILYSYFIFLSIPFVFGYVFRKFQLPSIIGYILGGLVIGTFFSPIVNSSGIENFASLGIILLMFTVGLEVNFERLMVLKKFIIFGGLLQIILTILAITVCSVFFGFSLLQAFLIGIAISSSSTALVAKLIQDKGEESSFVGELTTGMLMFQDLCFIPFILVFRYLNASDMSVFNLVKSIVFGVGETAIILTVLYIGGKRIVPLLFDRISRVSRELLNLFIIIFIFLIASVSAWFGIPMLIGVFIAGVLVSQTLEHYHIFSQIRPFRDIMAIIFFVFIGTHIQLGSLVMLLPQILLFTSIFVIVKIVIIIGVFVYMKFSSKVSLSMGLFLFQVSENAFILLSIAFKNQLFTSDQYQSLITSVLLTLIITPVLINNKDGIYHSLRSLIRRFIPQLEVYIKNRLDFAPVMFDKEEMQKHIIICGYGRVGSYIGRALTLAHIPFVAIDYNYHMVEKAKKEGVHIMYGDPTDMDILVYAGVKNAVALVSVVPDSFSQESIILNAKKLNNNLLFISRVHSHSHHIRMRDLGVDIVVQPEFEASLSIIKKLFFYKHLSKEEMVQKIHHFKIEQGLT